MARIPQDFDVLGAEGDRYAVHALGAYHKYWMDTEKTVKNPNFDQTHSGLILSAKRSDHANHAYAIKCFTKMIREAALRFDDDQIELVVVPSHTQGEVSAGLRSIAENLCKTDERFRYRHNSLSRTKSIAKLAGGGDRRIEVHLDSISFRRDLKMRCGVLILDDVSTTGNSIAACGDIISGQRRSVVGGLVLGRTADE